MVDDSVKMHLRAAQECAISGPNSLEVTYSETYTFSKQYFDGRPEAVTAIEKTLRQIVGKPVQVRFRVVAETIEDTSESHQRDVKVQPG